MANTLNYGFPKPDTAKNIDEEFYVFRDTTLDMIDAAIKAVADAAASKSAIGHGHAIGDVAGLAGALESKMPASQTFSLDSLTDVEGAAAAAVGQVLWKTSTGWLPTSALAALGPHGHLIPEITGLVDALLGKADVGATADALALRVRADAAQSFTAAQQGRVRANIGGGVLAGFRNKLINGDFDIWQRAVSFSAAAPAYTADRWYRSFAGSSLASTLSRQDFALGQTDVPGNPKNFLRYAVTTVNLTEHSIQQPIEGVQTLAGRRATLTFWAKGGFTLPSIDLVQGFGTGGSPSANVVVTVASALAIAAGWTKYTYAVDIPNVSGKTLGSNGNDRLALAFRLPLAAAFTFDLAHVSLVEGDATAEEDPFTPLHPQQILALCQRYFETSAGTTFVLLTNVANNYPCMMFRTVKRALPTMTTSAGSPSLLFIQQGGFYQTISHGSDQGIQWTADAEL